MLALIERQYLHHDMTLRCGIEQSLQLLACHYLAANWTPQHRLIEDDPQLRSIGRTKPLLADHASGDPFLQLLLAAECAPHTQNRSRVPLGLQQTRHDMRRVLTDGHHVLAARWGSEPRRPVGKTVWAEVPLEAQPVLRW